MWHRIGSGNTFPVFAPHRGFLVFRIRRCHSLSAQYQCIQGIHACYWCEAKAAKINLMDCSCLCSEVEITYFLYHHSFHSNAKKNLGNFLVRSAFKFNDQPGTFTCKQTRCKTCHFISNTVKISGPNRSVKVTDHFTCISTNVIYCITCTLCKKIYIGETGRRLADRFGEHLRDAEQNNLLNHSHHSMTICGLSLHHGNTESRKNLEQKFIFQLGTLSPHGINERLSFH